ncbi:MAG TPA: hypothetical protein VFX13_05940 [Gaiellales bacterium]|nr:hypothetical protein [Gaiellales bacterium]
MYERVNELVGEGRSRTEAFAQIAQERSSRPGTIAANYYRTARAQGTSGTGSRRSTRARRSSAAGPRAASAATRKSARVQDGDIGRLANQISDLVQQLVRQVQERDQRIRELLG